MNDSTDHNAIKREKYEGPILHDSLAITNEKSIAINIQNLLA